MGFTSSPSLPITDPALCDDWELEDQNTAILPSSTHSDEFEALHCLHNETIAKKTEEGQVIQHRAWKVGEVFYSDIDHLQETPSRARILKAPLLPISSPAGEPLKMPSLLSSPVAYPPDSSPIGKRPAPASTVPTRPRILGASVDANSYDEDDFTIEEPSAKRRMLDVHGSDATFKIKAAEVSGHEKDNGGRIKQGNKPHTIGGFLIDSDDSDDDMVEDNLGKQTFPEKTTHNAQRHFSPTAAPLPSFLAPGFNGRKEGKTCSGKVVNIQMRQKSVALPFKEMAAARSTTKAGRAKKSYYGIDIHQLVADASKEIQKEKLRESVAPEVPLPSVEPVYEATTRKTHMWTEKYRARRFFDLVGDDRTHREVLRWLKGWDPIVFPRLGKPKPAVSKRPGMDGELEEKTHRKILLLTGPPGLGKTTLAHVCAVQAGYEIMEINASDDRSANVVKGRIRTSVGTESVKTIGSKPKDGQKARPVRPVCVVVDEVDGVVGGAGGSGEGGFIKALIDLIQLDAKNSAPGASATKVGRKKKEDDFFRLLRPMILICNDVYHPSLRALRQSTFAEVIHMRKPPLEAVITRMKTVFEKEGVACEGDGVRKLCEATWGMSSGPEARFGSSGTGEGDLRSVLVVGEWVARKLKTDNSSKPKLTKQWVEQNMTSALGHSGGGARGVGRGGAKEVVSRVFLTGAGFPQPTAAPVQKPSSGAVDANVPRTKLHAAEIAKKVGMDRLREMVDTSDDHDRIVTDIFSTYPSQQFNDDSLLSKPNAAYEWLNFYNMCSKGVYQEQSWELMPYLCQPILACHDLFASPAKHFSQDYEKKKIGDDGETEVELPFTGPKADYDATEMRKQNRAMLVELQDGLRDENHIFREQNATLLRSFRSPEDMATDLLPYLVRILSPNVKPVIVGGSGDSRGVASVRKEGEREMVKRAVEVMAVVGVTYQRGKLEGEFGARGTQWVYRMDPPLDTLIDFPTAGISSSFSAAPTRYAVRQVLDQEYQKAIKLIANAARQTRFKAGNTLGDNSSYSFSSVHEDKRIKPINYDENPLKVKKDFFGRVLSDKPTSLEETDGNAQKDQNVGEKKEMKVWVTFHEGFSNAVRKPITLEELLRGL